MSRPTRHKHNFPFLGLMKCGECGSSISAQLAKGNGGTYRYYRCTKRISPCSQKYLREDLLIKQVKEKLNKVTLSKYYANKMLAQVEVWEKEESFSADTLINDIKTQLNDTELKLDRLVDSFLDGIIDREIYLFKKDELIRKKQDLSAKKSHLLKNGHNWNEPLKNWIIEASSVDKLVSSENYSEMKNFLEKIGTNRRMREKKIEIDFKKPWDLLYFSDNSLKRPIKFSGRSPRKKFLNCEKSTMWSPLLNKARTVFMTIILSAP